MQLVTAAVRVWPWPCLHAYGRLHSHKASTPFSQ